MQIYGVSFDMVGKQPIVLLKTADGNRFLPIWIGHPEAAAILMKLQGASTPRPMTHDLMADLLDNIDAKCERIALERMLQQPLHVARRSCIAAIEQGARRLQRRHAGVGEHFEYLAHLLGRDDRVLLIVRRRHLD